MLKKAYYHPFEKYQEKETALKLNKDLKKEINQFIDSFQLSSPALDKGLAVIPEGEEEQSFMHKQKNTLSKKQRVTLKLKRDW